ncbi:unnamed protein product [Durusdinium trenchii]|uniref:Uncharacterized protein n=2 Tax=Durusdinium trenchii TaxID=1381693 RepID=A0ABP0KGG8_9DINO
MQELSLVEGNQRRDFSDIVWQITERCGCNEFVVRYDCGHSLRAEVVAPALPSTKEYGTTDPERRRYAQHCLYVLTRNPGVTQVQVTVSEGRCRHCQRGQRQTLVCGPVHVDLREPASPGLVAKALGNIPMDALSQAKRIVLPMTAHAFLAAIGQVCKLPDGAGLPAPSGLEATLETPFAAKPLLKEEMPQWERKEIEDEMESFMLRYVCCAFMVLLCFLCEFGYVLGRELTPQESMEEYIQGELEEQMMTAQALSNLTSLSSLEFRMANSTWTLSALTLAVHKAFGPEDMEGMEAAGSSGGILWSAIHPLWVALLLVLGPIAWMDCLLALPRSMLAGVIAGVRELILRPGGFMLGIAGSTLLFLLRSFFAPPTLFVTSGPTANPILGAGFISISLAAITSPVPLTLLAHDLCSVIANWDIVRRLRRAAGHKAVGSILDRLPSLGAPRSKGSRAKKDGDSGRRNTRSDSGRGDKMQAKDEKGTIVPSCFVCLDKPSRYILEPCGHRVVCGDCAVQLVDAATRSRTEDGRPRWRLVGPIREETWEGTERGDRGGGNCPSCGLAINRAMRIFI